MISGRSNGYPCLKSHDIDQSLYGRMRQNVFRVFSLGPVVNSFVYLFSRHHLVVGMVTVLGVPSWAYCNALEGLGLGL